MFAAMVMTALVAALHLKSEACSLETRGPTAPTESSAAMLLVVTAANPRPANPPQPEVLELVVTLPPAAKTILATSSESATGGNFE